MKNDAMRRRGGGVKLPSLVACAALVTVWFPVGGQSQVNSGSNGSDGAFNPATNVVIDMADHPNGIYQYTSVNIPSGVTVTFVPNSNNTPVVWLVQSDCVVRGQINLNGGAYGGSGGPGGYRAGIGGAISSAGLGPGGGNAGPLGGNASYGTCGSSNQYSFLDGRIYGTPFLIPLLGGSGGAGGANGVGFNGGGGGGAILIVASGTIGLFGAINACGGEAMYGYQGTPSGGGGSGGAVRLVATLVEGYGTIDATGGQGPLYSRAGSGRIRFDVLDTQFGGAVKGAFSKGYQPILFPSGSLTAQLTIITMGGVSVSSSPAGILTIPDAVIPAQQPTPVPIVVRCSNLPLNSSITVTVRSATGISLSASGQNTAGTLSSSTATVLMNIPRGGGIIWATAATGS